MSTFRVIYRDGQRMRIPELPTTPPDPEDEDDGDADTDGFEAVDPDDDDDPNAEVLWESRE